MPLSEAQRERDLFWETVGFGTDFEGGGPCFGQDCVWVGEIGSRKCTGCGRMHAEDWIKQYGRSLQFAELQYLLRKMEPESNAEIVNLEVPR